MAPNFDDPVRRSASYQRSTSRVDQPAPLGTIIPTVSLNGRRDLWDRRAQMLDVTVARIVAPNRRRTRLIPIEVDTGEPRPSNLRLTGLIPVHHFGRVRLEPRDAQVIDIVDLQARRRYWTRIANQFVSGPFPMTTFNPILVGKLFNFAGHPGTPDTEAAIAARKAYSHCSSRGVALEDATSFVNRDTLDRLLKMPKKQLLIRNADLQIALEDAQARIVAQGETIADLRRSKETDASLRKADASTIAALKAEREVNAATIAALQSEIASLNETVARQQDAFAAASAIEPVAEPAMTMIEESVVEETVRRRAAAKRTTSTGVRKSARIVTDEPMADPNVETPEANASSNTRPWSLAEWARFNALAALGRATSSIVRTLSREFGRLVTTARVGAMRRERWLSPGYGLA